MLGETVIKRLSYLLWLADATALDDDVVKGLELGQTDELLEEVAAEGAADAAIL